jgi:membrane-associated phospholipid phosphatase
VAYLLSSSQLGRTWRWVGSGISFGVLLAVAFSRLYLDVHWLSDVFGGFTLGLAYLLTIIWLVELARHRRQGQGLSVTTGRPATAERSLSRRVRISSLT